MALNCEMRYCVTVLLLCLLFCLFGRTQLGFVTSLEVHYGFGLRIHSAL